MDAQTFAIQAHGSQLYGSRPYGFHLEWVVDLAGRFCPAELDKSQVTTVSWLHDTLEDTDVSFEVIMSLFGPVVARAVRELTAPKGETKEEEFRRLAKASPLAKHVKACDLAANMAACVADLHLEYLGGYSNNLPGYERALGNSLTGELFVSCKWASLVAEVGQSRTILSRNAHGGGESHWVIETTQVTWILPAFLKNGLVFLNSEQGDYPSIVVENEDA